MCECTRLLSVGQEIEVERARELREAVRDLVVAHGTLEEARRPCGTPLSMPHAYALLELLHHQPLTVTELASRLSIDRTNVSRLCVRMENGGEAVREPDPRDGRVRLVTLTRTGEELATEVDRQSAQHFANLLKHLGEDADPVLDGLRRLRDAMANNEESG